MAWKPGESGNPNGRPPKGATFTDAIREKLEERGEDGRTRLQKVVDTLFTLAEQGDGASLRYLVDRLDGKAKESISMEVQNRYQNGDLMVQAVTSWVREEHPELVSELLAVLKTYQSQT